MTKNDTSKKDSEKKDVKEQSSTKTSMIKKLSNKKWFFPFLFLICAMIFYLPALGLNKIIMGTDDGPRGWHTKNNYGHALESFSDKWSPLNGGTAMMERRYGRFINPTHLFHMVLPKYQARVFEYLFWTFIAGYFTFLLLNLLGISKGVSSVCALGYMLSPAFLSYIYGGHFARMEVIALLPALMFFTERILAKVSLLDLIGLPITMALAVYSDHLQLAFFAFLGMGIYFACRMIWMVFIAKELQLLEGTKRTSFFAISLVIGALLTAMSIFPSMHHTNVTSKRAGGVDYDYAASFALHPEEMFNLYQPDFIGWREFYWGQNPLKLNNEYFGVCFLLLAIMLFLFRKQGFKQYLFAGFFMLAILFSLGAHTPIHKIAYHLIPGIKSFRGPSMMYIWFFLTGIILAGYALDQFFNLTWDKQSPTCKRLYIFAGIVAGFSLIYLFASESFCTFWYNSLFPVEMQNQNKLDALQRNFKHIKTGALLIFLFVSTFFTISYLKLSGKISKQTFLTILIIIISIDLLRLSYPFLTKALKPANYFKRQEEVELSIEKFLRNRDKSIFRVHHLMGDMKMYIPGLEMTYIFDDFTNQRYNDIIERLRPTAYALSQPQYANNPTLHNSFRNILSLLNAKYIISLSKLPITGLSEMINSGGLRIYKNERVFPRFYLVNEFTKESNTGEALFKNLDSYLFSQNNVIVDKEEWQNRTLESSVDSAITNKVIVKQYDPRNGNHILSVTSNSEQILVVSENHTNGWTASLNGKQTDIFSVNHYAKGIVVPKGTSSVEFTYNSIIAQRWRKVTLLCSILFLLFAIYVGFVQFRQYKGVVKKN